MSKTSEKVQGEPGKPANAYPIAEHLKELGTKPLSTVLLERNALAYGLQTQRVGSLDFVARDGRGHSVGFNRTGSSLNSRSAAPLTGNKHSTRLLLERAGVPAPRGRRFSFADQESAVEYAEMIGYPVVFKPLSGMEGKGVVTGIRSAEDLRWAFESVRGTRFEKDDLLVEEHVDGETYRVVVVEGKAVSILIARRGSIVGDGNSTVSTLIANRQKMREQNPHLMGRPIKISEQTERLLGQQGYGLEDVVPTGERVYFTFGSNTHQGGEPSQVLDIAHPSIIDASERAAKALPGLGFAGVDFIIPDIEASLDSQRAAICEINSVPAADSHEFPLFGPPLPVTEELFTAAAAREGVRLSDRAEEVDVNVSLNGSLTEDDAAALVEKASNMGVSLRWDLAPVPVTGRAQGRTEHVAILLSLIFACKGVRSVSTSPRSGLM